MMMQCLLSYDYLTYLKDPYDGFSHMTAAYQAQQSSGMVPQDAG